MESDFPQSMLDAIRDLDHEERVARIEYIASMDARRAVARTEVPAEQGDILQHLLRDLGETERNAIIERMQANGTAQALRDWPPQGEPEHPIALWQRLTRNQPRSGDLVESDSDDETDRQGLDIEDDGRPDPKTDEELMVKMDCKVCYTQMADTACLPCGHLVLCQWCSEQPVSYTHLTLPTKRIV